MIQKDLPLAAAPLGESVGYQFWDRVARCWVTSDDAWEVQSPLALVVAEPGDEDPGDEDPAPGLADDLLELHAEAASRTTPIDATACSVRFLDRARLGAFDSPM
jgi:hypothetical protein